LTKITWDVRRKNWKLGNFNWNFFDIQYFEFDTFVNWEQNISPKFWSQFLAQLWINTKKYYFTTLEDPEILNWILSNYEGVKALFTYCKFKAFWRKWNIQISDFLVSTWLRIMYFKRPTCREFNTFLFLFSDLQQYFTMSINKFDLFCCN
jgi:hypothetical protein